EGSQGPGRRRPEEREGSRCQGRRRSCGQEAGGSRRQGRAEVIQHARQGLGAGKRLPAFRTSRVAWFLTPREQLGAPSTTIEGFPKCSLNRLQRNGFGRAP